MLSVQVVAVSTVVNHSVLKPYLFCNYTHPRGSVQRYPSSCEHKVYEALRASSAAPGFFEECKLGQDIHQVSDEHHGLPMYRLPICGIPMYGLPICGFPIYGLPIYGLSIYGFSIHVSTSC